MTAHVFFSAKFAVVLTILALLALQVAGAQVMSSPSYQLQSDSINVGGGLSSSSNYVQESTVGEIATGPSDSTSFSLRAGYQQMQEVFLSLSAPADVTMGPALGGLTGGTSNGSTTVTVITDSPAGYQLTIQAENDPAMQRSDGESIFDFFGTGFAQWGFIVPSGLAYFGFTVTGDDTENDFIDNGAFGCGGGGSTEAINCWDGLATSPISVAQSTGGNQPAGATTTIHFRVGIDSDAAVLEGLYTATTTLTAYPL